MSSWIRSCTACCGENGRFLERIARKMQDAMAVANEALERAANVVRHGDTRNVIVVLTGATVMGWMLSRFSRADLR